MGPVCRNEQWETPRCPDLEPATCGGRPIPRGAPKPRVSPGPEFFAGKGTSQVGRGGGAQVPLKTRGILVFHVLRTTRDLRGRCGVRLASARQDCGRLGGDPARNPSACRLLVNSGPLSRHGHTPCQFRTSPWVRYGHRGTGTGCGGNDRDSLAPRTAGSRSANAAQLSTRRLSRASLTRGLGDRRGGLQQALHPDTEP